MGGAERRKKDDCIDFSAGIVLHHKTNSLVKRGDVLATLHTANETLASAALQRLGYCYTICPEPAEPFALIGDFVEGPY